MALQDLRVGAGGWSYFHVPGEPHLESYARAFDFVEVNVTFYRIPPSAMVKSWRRRVPAGFEFAVRAHRDLSHRHRLKPTEEAFWSLKRSLAVCDDLGAGLLHIAAPPDLTDGDAIAKDLAALFGSADLGSVRAAVSFGGIPATKMAPTLAKAMDRLSLTHAVDLSQEAPAVASDLVYARLFGPGKHNQWQFADEELRTIHRRAEDANARTVRLTFHGVRMYTDAARLQTYMRTGAFPSVTRAEGLLSLEEVLKEDARFPATKASLVEDQGWKVIDLAADRRVHASELLKTLPEGRYGSLDEVIDALEARRPVA